MCSRETKRTLWKLFIPLCNPELNMYFTVHKLGSRFFREDELVMPVNFWTCPEGHIPFHQHWPQAFCPVLNPVSPVHTYCDGNVCQSEHSFVMNFRFQMQ